MAIEGKRIIEWEADAVKVPLGIIGENEEPNLAVTAQATGDPGEVALHVRGITTEGGQLMMVNLYLQAHDADLLAERIRTAAFIAGLNEPIEETNK